MPALMRRGDGLAQFPHAARRKARIDAIGTTIL